MCLRLTSLSVILAVFSLILTAKAQVSVEPIGFAVAIEQEDTLETELIIHNPGEEAVPYSIRIRKMNREDEDQFGPRRDEPGETLAEIQLDYRYIVGLAWDAENQIMYAAHNAEARITGYLWNGEEILDVPVDFVTQNIPAGSLVALAFFENVFFTFYWGQSIIYRYDIEGNQLESINTQWNDDVTYGLGLAVDPENAYLYMSAFHNAGLHSDIKIYDINDDFAQVGYIDGIENMGDQMDADVRNRLCWVPEHEDGHLWVYERNYAEANGAVGPYSPPYHAWQLDIIPDEEGNWDYEVVTHFEVESDAWSNGIEHDGENLWIGTRDDGDNTVRIVDDGISEAKWITIEPRSGEIAAGEDAALDVVIIPVELENGVYEQLVSIRFGDPVQLEIEMSAVMSLETPTAMVYGTVTNEATGDPVENAKAELDYYIINRLTDDEGGYSFDDLPMGEYAITFTHPDYVPSMVELVIEEGGEIVENVGMLHAEFNPDPDQVGYELSPDDNGSTEFTISNDGNAAVEYTSEFQLLGEANADPWETRETYDVRGPTEDNRAAGITFDGEFFYVAGGAGGDPELSKVYVFSNEGEYLRQFDQFMESRYGIRDMAFDGELLWGIDADQVYGFTTNGELEIQFEGPHNPSRCITYDSDLDLIWLCSTSTDLVAVDSRGEVALEYDRPPDLRMSSLAYYPADPDGYCLYVFGSIGDEYGMVYKVNTADGASEYVATIDTGDDRMGGTDITSELDVYSWVVLTILQDTDQIGVIQLEARKDWISYEPENGVIETGEEQVFDVAFDSHGFPEATLEGEIVFNHNGFGQQTIIPVTLSVVWGRIPTERTIRMTMGWNMVSVNLQPDEEDVVVLTRGLVDDEILLMMKDGFGHFYRPDFNYNDIPGWFVEQGYLMKVTDDCELTLEGMSVLWNDPIDLIEGWQIASYYPRVEVDARIALSGIVDNLQIAKNGNGNFYLPAWDFSDMGNLRQGQGYMLKMTEDTRLIYRLQAEGDDEMAASLPNKRSGTKPVNLSVHPNTGFNMSLLVECAENVSGEIGVYCGDQLVGSGVIREGQCGIAVWGDDPSTEAIDGACPGDELRISLFDETGEREAGYFTLDGTNVYETNAYWVVELDGESLTPIQFGITAAYPNPFNSSTRISYSLPEASEIKLAMYDLSGRLVETVVNGVKAAGLYTVTINSADLASGLYILQLESGAEVSRQKLTLIK